MFAPRTVCLLILAASTLAAVGCTAKQAPPAREPAPHAAPVGAWDLQATDTAGTRWIATLVILQDTGDNLRGYIDWCGGNGHGGRELVTGSFDPATRVVQLRGHAIEHGRGITTGVYRVDLAPDGIRLLNGSWGGDGIPGNWNALRLSPR